MNDKVIWSSNMTQDYISNLSDDAKRNALIDRGYDEETLAGDLDDVIAQDDYMWQEDAEEFENEIAPMINNQTFGGIVLGLADNRDTVLPLDTEELISSWDIGPEFNGVEIIDNGAGIEVDYYTNDDLSMTLKLYAIPETETEQQDFVQDVMPEYAASVSFESDEGAPQIDYKEVLSDRDILEEYVNKDALMRSGKRIKYTNIAESFDEENECTFPEEPINEDRNSGVGYENGQRFIEYLKDNDRVDNGPFGEDPIINKGGSVRLFSQGSDVTFTFTDDGGVIVEGHDETIGDQGFDEDIEEYFDTVNDFVDWFEKNQFAYGSDLGGNIGRYLYGESLDEEFKSWTDAYKLFTNCAERFYPDEDKISEAAKRVYEIFKGDPNVEEAWKRWNDTSSVDESLGEDFAGVLSTDEFESVISGGLGRNRGDRDDSFISDEIGDVIGNQLNRLGLDFDDFSDYTEMYDALDDRGKRIVSNKLRKHIDLKDIGESLTEGNDCGDELKENYFSELNVNEKKAFIQKIINSAIAKLPEQYRSKVKYQISDQYFQKNDNGCKIYVITKGVTCDAISGTVKKYEDYPDIVFYERPVNILIDEFKANHWRCNNDAYDREHSGEWVEIAGKKWKVMNVEVTCIFYNGGWDYDAISKHNDEAHDARTNRNSNVMDRQDAQRKQEIRDASRGDMDNNRRSPVKGADMGRQDRERQAEINAANRGNITYNSTRDRYESLDEGKHDIEGVENIEALDREIEDIKMDYEDFGPEGFYNVPFEKFRAEFPEFTDNIIMHYLENWVELSKEDLNDPEVFAAWQDGNLITDSDWPRLIEAGEKLANGKAIN